MVNTSFNARNEPLVNAPDDAYKCLMHTDLDYLVVGYFVFNKKDQPVVETDEK